MDRHLVSIYKPLTRLCCDEGLGMSQSRLPQPHAHDWSSMTGLTAAAMLRPGRQVPRHIQERWSSDFWT